jgi:hypothetical protein
VIDRLRSIAAAITHDGWLSCIVALLALTALAPRIPLDIAIPGRTFDLRLADLVLAAALPIWLVSRWGHLTSELTRPVIAYCVIALVATGLAVAALGLSPLRGALYLGKEIEYFAAMALVANTARRGSSSRTILATVIVVGIVNAAWFVVQLVVLRDMSLFSAERPLSPGVFVDPSRLASYGPHLTGEHSPFNVGGFFMIAFLVSVGWATSRVRSTRGVLILGAAAVVFVACLALIQSRISLVAAVIGAASLVPLAPRGERLRSAGFVLVVILVGLAFSAVGAQRHRALEPVPVITSPSPTASPSPVTPTATVGSTAPSFATGSPTASVGLTPRGSTSGPIASSSSSPAFSAPPPVFALPNPGELLTVGVARRLRGDAILYSVQERIDRVWAPLAQQVLKRPLFGYGKGSLGALPNLPAAEAHMAYLRVAVETGVVGTLAFLLLIAAVARLGLSLISHSGGTAPMMGRVACSLTVAMLVAGVAQDAFTPVVLTQTYWLLIGAAAGAYLAHGDYRPRRARMIPRVRTAIARSRSGPKRLT